MNNIMSNFFSTAGKLLLNNWLALIGLILVAFGTYSATNSVESAIYLFVIGGFVLFVATLRNVLVTNGGKMKNKSGIKFIDDFCFPVDIEEWENDDFETPIGELCKTFMSNVFTVFDFYYPDHDPVILEQADRMMGHERKFRVFTLQNFYEFGFHNHTFGNEIEFSFKDEPIVYFIPKNEQHELEYGFAPEEETITKKVNHITWYVKEHQPGMKYYALYLMKYFYDEARRIKQMKQEEWKSSFKAYMCETNED